MKQLSQLFVISSISFISASTSQDVLSTIPQNSETHPETAGDVATDVAVDVPARHSNSGFEKGNRKPAVEPRVYVEDESGSLYYYDYPNQEKHAEQNPPKL